MGVFAELLSTMAGIFIIGNLGTNSLSAAEITTQYDYWITIPILCAAQSCGILVGESIGRKDYDYAKRIANIANFATMVLPLAGLVINAIPQQLAEPFIASDATQDERDTIVAKTKTLFAINSAVLLLKSAYNVFSGALRGCKDVGFSAVNSFIAFGVFGLGVGSALSYKTSLEEAGIFVGRLGGIAVGTVGMASWWHRRKNKFACMEMTQEATTAIQKSLQQ
jgi:Na+-driven multidrug efflux pump